MELTKSFVINCRNVRLLREFLCQAIDQVDEKDKQIAELKQKINEFADCAENACLERDDCQNAIDELQDELRSTKRALWLARAKKAEIWERYWQIKISLLSFTCMYESKALFALEGYEEFPDTRFLHHTYRLAGKWELVWKKVKHLCIKKAEEYK